MLPPSQQSLNSLQGSQPLPSINEHGAQREEVPLPPLAPRHSKKRSTNSGMEATSAEMLAPGLAPSYTEEPTSALVIPVTASANGAGGAHAPKPPLANRPRPPAILLYPSASQQPTQIIPNQEVGHNPQSLSPRPSGNASEDAEECGSVVLHSDHQSMPPLWATSPAETPSSAIVNATPFYQSDLLQGCPSPSVEACMQDLPSTAATLTPGHSQQQNIQQDEGVPHGSMGARSRSSDSGVAAKANHHHHQQHQQQQQQQQHQEQLPGGQGNRHRHAAASWDSGTSPPSASATAATGYGSLGNGVAARHVQSTSYDTIGTTDITLAPPPVCTLTAGTNPTSATTAAAAAAAAARGQHCWGHPEQQPAVREGAEAQVFPQDKCGETVFMNLNPLAHLPTYTDPIYLPPRTYPVFESASHPEDGGVDTKGQKEGLEGVNGHTAAQLTEAVAAANRVHAEERAMAGSEESVEDVMSGRITVVEEDVMGGRVTVVEEDESGEVLAAREHDEEQREEGDALHQLSCGSCDDDVPEREQERALIGAADSAAADDAEAAADRAALSVGCGFGAAFGIGGSARGLGASSAAHASANITVTHNNSLYAHGDVASGHGDGGNGGLNGGMGVDGAGVVAEPAPELMPAPKTWHSTLDTLWDRLSLALFLLAFILDIVALVSFAANNCGQEWWVPTILFILAHTTFMGVVLLIHSQWAKRCWRAYLVVLNGPECIALRTPWCRQSSARFFLYVPQFFIALFTLAIGSMVSAFVLGGIILIAVCAVPLLDLSAAAATIWPTGDKKRFRSQDLLFLENFKLARYSLQAVLQSVPQIILLAISLSSLGPINGDPSETAQCNAPEGVAIAALAVASLNVLDKLFQSGLQVKHMVGRHGLNGVRGLWQNTIDLITVQGSHRVPFPVMDRTLAQMLRSASDFVVGADFVNEPHRPPPAESNSTTLNARAHSSTQPPVQVVVGSSPPNGESPSTAQDVQGSSVDFQQSAARSGSGSEGGDTDAAAAAPASATGAEGAPTSPSEGLRRLNITPSASPAASPSTPVDNARTSSPRTRNFLRRGGIQGGSSSSLSTPRMQHLDRVRNGMDLLRVMQGRGAELAERMPAPAAVQAERSIGSMWSRDRPSGSVPLVPSLLLPPHGGRLEAGQMATVVREAIARYPHHSITRWAMESPRGANQGLVDIMAGGLTRFTALQNLTICKCKIGGHGFVKVAKLLVSHPHLRDLRFEHVAVDKMAAGALADLVRNAARITRLDIANCMFPKNNPEAVSGIVSALGSNTSLSTLTFAGNGLDAKGIRALTEGLSKNTSLCLLDLSTNPQLSSRACLAALGKLLTAVDQRHSQAESMGTSSVQPPLRLVLTIKDLGFDGAQQLVSQLGQQQQQTLSQLQLPMPPCTIVSHGPLPPSCLHVSGLPLWLLAGGAEGRAAVEALMPSGPPPRPSPHPTSPQGMGSIQESSSPPTPPQDSRQPTLSSAPPASETPNQNQPPHSQGAAAGAAPTSSPFAQSDGSTHQGSPFGRQHSQGPLLNPSDPTRSSTFTSSENYSGSSSSVRGPVSSCELLLVCGGVDNLSLVGVLCACHRVLGEFLSSLDLSGLSICDRGAKLMGSLVQHTPRLEAVRLAGCNITDEGAEPLVVALTERVCQTTSSPSLSVDVSKNTLGDGAASKIIQLALTAARARHVAAVRAVISVALQCGCNPQEASATTAAVLAGQGETEAVQAVQEMGRRLRQQLRITLLDNLYPMSMEPLRGLQRALTKSAAPLSASAIAAEATMLLQPPPQQRQQDDQHPLQEAQAQQGETVSSPPTPPPASPFGQQLQHGQAQDEEQGAGTPGASAPIPSLAPVTDPRAAAAFGPISRSEVVAVALRIANTLLGRTHAAAADPPPAFVLELVHRPPGQVAGPPPPRPQPQAPSAARARRLSGGLSNQGLQGLTGLRPIPSAAVLELDNIDVEALAPRQPPSPTSVSGANAGATNDDASNAEDSSPYRQESLTTPFTEFMLPSHTEEHTTWAAQQQQQQQRHHRQHHRHQRHRRNVSASDAGCLPGLGATVAAAAPSFASNLLSPRPSAEGNGSNPQGLRPTSAGAVATTATTALFSRHSVSLVPTLSSSRTSGMPPSSPPPHCSVPLQPPSFMGPSRSQYRRTPSDALNSASRPHQRHTPTEAVPSSSRPPHHRHTRTVSATESQIEATTAVISGALAGDEGLTGLALVGLGPTPSHSRNVSGGSMPALSRSHTRTTSLGSDGDNGCGVCFDNPSNLLLRGCGHKICVQCYRQLVRPGAAPSARCPFCRSLITGFDYRLGSDQALLWH